MKLKKIQDQVIVITGASSGIGLATAQAAAKKGAKLVLTSRNSEALKDITNSITANGGDAVYVTADVSERNQLQAVAQKAIDNFGRIDTWVNNAGTSLWGYLDEVAEEDQRRLFEVNFWGVVNGSLIAVDYLKKSGGSLINLGSIASEVGLPLQGMYSASKHAIKGFTDTLRVELINKKYPISVTLIKPASMGTPLHESLKNYRPHDARLLSPIYKPEEAANAILESAQKQVREVYIGGAAPIMYHFNRLLPGLADKIAAKFVINAELHKGIAENKGNSIYESSSKNRVHGNHPGQAILPSVYTRAVLNPLTHIALMGAGLFLAAKTIKKITE